MKIKFRTAAATPRPIRLCELTREFANESLKGIYGDSALQNPWISMDDVVGFGDMSSYDKYDTIIRRICETAPIRICDNELVSGAATLGMAIGHAIPANHKGKIIFSSISHLTIDYEKTLKYGIDGYYVPKITERMNDPSLTEKQRRFLESLLSTVESMRIWHGRYLNAVKGSKPEIYENLTQVPFKPARTFYEAVQAIWFQFAFTRLCGNWPGIGRIDVLLGDYLKRDLADGILTINEAREILASLFIKGCEWIQTNTPRDTGDAQHYQNIVLAGIGEDGKEVTNEVTYLVLDIVEELPISDFPISVRLNRKTPEKLLRKISKVIRHGGGVVAVYNEELVINALTDNGYSLSEARKFANDGCWEVQIPGKTNFGYIPHDGLQALNRAMGLNDESDIPDYADFEELYAAFVNELGKDVENIYNYNVKQRYVCDGGIWHLSYDCIPTSVISLFEDGCIDNAASYEELGPVYTVRSPHIGGAPDVANSLHAIDRLVFKEKRLTFPELVRILRRNWEGEEALRLYAYNKIPYYGNDDDEADGYMRRVVDSYVNIVENLADPECPCRFIPGISTFGRQVGWISQRCATAFGAKKGAILAGNGSPTPGTDSSGATAIIQSYCKCDLRRVTCGAALDLKIFPESLKGENGITALKALLRGVVSLGGFFVQIDTVDRETLLEAQKHPEQYKMLSVRVSGWNARFVTLNDEWQKMIIERTSTGM